MGSYDSTVSGLLMKRLSYVTSQLAAAAILLGHNFCAALRAFSSHFFLLGLADVKLNDCVCVM